jgi:hypothetical protein
MRLMKIIFWNFFSLFKVFPRLIIRVNHRPKLEVLRISAINQNSSIISMTVSMSHVIFVRINNQYFYNPQTKISLTFVIPINDNRELKIQGLGLLKRTKKYSYDLSNTNNLSIEKFNPKIKFKKRLNLRLNAQKLKTQRSIKLNPDNIRLSSNTIKIINQGMVIDYTCLNVIKD